MMELMLLIVATLMLAAGNGANDNIKGAVTLLGSGLLGFRAAIGLATAATALGGVVSIYLANGLLAAFSGKGIVPAELTLSASFLLSVAIAGGVTVWLATRFGLPISTTHALLGGLLGAGLAAAPDRVEPSALLALASPLLVSPVLALLLALGLAPLLQRWRRRLATEPACACVDSVEASGDVLLLRQSLHVGRGDAAHCAPAPGRQRLLFDRGRWLDRLHLLSAAAVSFARGLNDTPKIAALMAAAGVLGAGSASLAVVLAMAVGGWLAAARVADTLAYKVTRMDAGEGVAGNLVTTMLVIFASRFGLPVSTTHVSTGALFGIAIENRSGHVAVIRNILLAWLATLPIAALIAYLIRSLFIH